MSKNWASCCEIIPLVPSALALGLCLKAAASVSRKAAFHLRPFLIKPGENHLVSLTESWIKAACLKRAEEGRRRTCDAASRGSFFVSFGVILPFSVFPPRKSAFLNPRGESERRTEAYTFPLCTLVTDVMGSCNNSPLNNSHLEEQ